MKKTHLTSLILTVTCSLLFLSGCQSIRNFFKSTQEDFIGLSGTVQTYDENAQIIDKITGNNISIESDNRFDITDSEGNISKESSVLDISVGRHSIIHVGSTLIFAEKGLTDQLESYRKTTDLTDNSHSLPFINRFFEQAQNKWTGQEKLVLIRSQNGTPLATYFGNKVSTYAAEGIPNTTYLLIDNKRLIIYRAEFTIYDTAILNR